MWSHIITYSCYAVFIYLTKHISIKTFQLTRSLAPKLKIEKQFLMFFLHHTWDWGRITCCHYKIIKLQKFVRLSISRGFVLQMRYEKHNDSSSEYKQRMMPWDWNNFIPVMKIIKKYFSCINHSFFDVTDTLPLEQSQDNLCSLKSIDLTGFDIAV